MHRCIIGVSRFYEGVQVLKNISLYLVDVPVSINIVNSVVVPIVIHQRFYLLMLGFKAIGNHLWAVIRPLNKLGAIVIT